MDGDADAPRPLAGAGNESIPQLRVRFEEQAAAVGDRAAWEALRLAWLGRKHGEPKATAAAPPRAICA